MVAITPRVDLDTEIQQIDQLLCVVAMSFRLRLSVLLATVRSQRS